MGWKGGFRSPSGTQDASECLCFQSGSGFLSGRLAKMRQNENPPLGSREAGGWGGGGRVWKGR